jgi:hypothetical protein
VTMRLFFLTSWLCEGWRKIRDRNSKAFFLLLFACLKFFLVLDRNDIPGLPSPAHNLPCYQGRRHMASFGGWWGRQGEAITRKPPQKTGNTPCPQNLTLIHTRQGIQRRRKRDKRRKDPSGNERKPTVINAFAAFLPCTVVLDLDPEADWWGACGRVCR